MECNYCGANTPESTYCQTCNYPLLGTDQEKGRFVAKQVMDESNVKDALSKMKYPRNILFVIAGINILAAIVQYQTLDLAGIIISIVIGLMFTGFALLTMKSPKIAILIPLILILIYYTLLAVILPDYFMSGIVWKVFIVIGLSFSLYTIFDAEKILRNNPYVAKKMGFTKIGKRNNENPNLIDDKF